jgi:hypothetical protein
VSEEPADHDPLEDLRLPFVEWFDAKVWLDSQAVARRDPNPTWCTTVTALYGDFCGWLIERDQAPSIRDQFRSLLQELGCAIRLIAGEEFVANVALKEDWLAQQKFENPPPPARVKLYVANVERP